MYEVDFSGWTRTPESLKMIETNKRYRFKINLKRYFAAIRQRRWKYVFDPYFIKQLILNRK